MNSKMSKRYKNKGTFSRLLLALFIFIEFSGVAQDYERVDAIISLYPKSFENPEVLSKFIARDFTSDDEKVRAIYTWIVENIAYDPDEYKQFDYIFTNYRERNEKEEKLRAKIINRTLQKGVAVCEGYAMLFEKLCQLQSIPNYLVRGDTKSNFPDIGRSFERIHMWNVVTIGKKPYLFDPTWGAGKYNGKFIKDTSYFYFKTPPEQFIKSHYPDMYEDAFISEQLSKEAFSAQPLIIEKSLLPHDILNPKKGLLFEADYFGEVSFSIKNINPEIIAYSYGNDILPINKVIREEEGIKFSVPLSIGAANLLVYFDGKPALGYKIK